MFSARFDQLVQALRVLPSVGPKSAQRMALHLMLKNREGAYALAHALTEASNSLHACQVCHSLTEADICDICNAVDRDAEVLCVVEGQATAHYLLEASKHLPLTMTRIAQGVPQGGELEYVDSHTLSQAVHNRMRMK